MCAHVLHFVGIAYSTRLGAYSLLMVILKYINTPESNKFVCFIESYESEAFLGERYSTSYEIA